MNIPFIIIMLLLVVLGVVFTQSSRVYFKNSTNVGAATVIAELLAGILALLWTFFFPSDLSMSLYFWILLLIACVFYAINDRFSSEVKKHLDVSVFSILNRSSDVFLIIVGILIFGQIPTLFKIISAILIILGQVALVYKKGKFEFNKYFFIALGVNLVFAIAVSIDIGISQQINLPVYVAFTLIVPAFFILLSEKITLTKLKIEFKSTRKAPLLVLGFSWGTWVILLLLGYQTGNIITVVTLSALTVLINVLIGIIFYKERENIWMKTLAAIFVVLGSIITLFS